MIVEHFGKIHLVKLVTRKYEYIIAIEWFNMSQALPHCIGGTLVPGWVVWCLFCRQDIYKCFAECTEMICVLYVPVERRRIELGEYKHASNTIIQAIGNWDIHKPVLSRDRYCRFGPAGCQRK